MYGGRAWATMWWHRIQRVGELTLSLSSDVFCSSGDIACSAELAACTGSSTWLMSQCNVRHVKFTPAF